MINTIKSIDLWTKQYKNHYECFNGAFVDDFENGKIAFDEYKIVKNCNCIITSSQENINISNRHNAIIFYKNKILYYWYEKKQIYNTANIEKEIDVGSCDRWNLLYNMLKGSYTESDTQYGNYEKDKYEFLPSIFIKYELVKDIEKFEIEHKSAFINILKTRIIPIQENSPLTK